MDDLEQWIAEREVVASSHELGQDYDHVTMVSTVIHTSSRFNQISIFIFIFLFVKHI